MAGYSARQSSFTTGDTILAAHSNDEFNQVLAAFHATTGHSHDGTAGEGGPISTLRDADSNNKILVDTSNNHLEFYVEVSSSAVEQVKIQDGAIVPVTDNDIDLGTSSLEFKDAFFDGTVTTDALVADTADLNGGSVDGATLGTNSAITQAVIDNININGTTIGHTSDTDLLTLTSGVLTVAGEVSMTTLDIGGTDVTSTAAELNLLDGITAGTVSASLAVIVDSNKDISGFRNVTLTGELDAGSLDISGDADIDGTLEADAITINGTTLAETISDTVGAMVSSNTETGISVTYDDADNTLDFVIGSTSITNAMLAGSIADSKLNTISTAGKVDIGALDIDGGTDIGAAIVDADLFIIDDGAGGANRKVTASRLKTYAQTGISTAYDDLTTGDAAVTVATSSGNITIDAQGDDTDIIFKGTDGGSDTTFLTIDGSAAGAATFNDKIIATELDISGNVDIDGTLETDALSIDSTTISATAAELNLIDGGATIGTTAVVDGDGIIHNDGGTMRVTSAATFKTYFTSGVSSAADDLTAGDAAVNLTTTSGNITIDAQAGDSDIIFKGTDDSSDITALTLDMSAAGEAIFNAGIVIADAGNIGSASDKDAIAIASDGVVTFSQTPVLSGASISAGTTPLTALDIDGGTDIGEDLVDADLFIVDNGAGGTNRKVAASRIKTYIGGGTQWQSVKTGNYTASAGEGVFVNTTSSAITITLPAGTLGDEISIVDYAGTFDSNACTIAANGSEKIFGSTDDLTVSTERAAFTLVFTDSTQGWLFKND
jgi:cytoskeletal protein CcmA (bactofilin family)